MRSHTKRGFCKCTGFAVAVLWGLLVPCAGPVAAAQNAMDLKPSPQQTEWQDFEFGVMLHFGTNAFLDREWVDGTAIQRSSIPRSSVRICR